MRNKLYKSTHDRIMAGVCGGIAQWLGIDSTVVRLVFAVLVICFGLSLWVYIIAALVMSKEPN